VNPKILKVIYCLGIALPIGMLITIPIWSLMGIRLNVLSYVPLLFALWVMVNFNPIFAELWEKLKDRLRK
jgi:hypothetical protein